MLVDMAHLTTIQTKDAAQDTVKILQQDADE
jgi:hypothetical protein